MKKSLLAVLCLSLFSGFLIAQDDADPPLWEEAPDRQLPTIPASRPPAADVLSPADSAPSGSGVQDNVLRRNYPTGELMAEYRYFEGKLDGLSRDYYKNGQVMYEWNYRVDKLHGVSRAYYLDGKPMSVLKYKEGLLNGAAKRFHRNGRVKSVESYRDGRLLRRIQFDENGRRVAAPAE